MVDVDQTTEQDRQRVPRIWWTPLVTGGALLLVAIVVSSPDLRWLFASLGAITLVAGGIASVMAVAAPTPRPSTTTPGLSRVGLVLVCAAALLCSLLWTREASSSGGVAPAFSVLFVFWLPVATLGGGLLLWATACALARRWSRRTTFVVAFVGLFTVIAATAVVKRQPFDERVHRNEEAMTSTAESLLAHPEQLPGTISADRSMSPGIWDRPPSETRLGDFEINVVALDPIDLKGCSTGPDTAGLRFWLGNSDTTSLIYCPAATPTPGLSSSTVDHVAGPWYIEYDDR